MSTAVVQRFVTAVIATLLVASHAGCRDRSAEEPAHAAASPTSLVLGPEDVALVRRSEISSGVLLTGTLEPGELVEIKAQVAGTIRNLRVDRGDPVRRGAPLASIEAEGVRSQAVGAQMSLAAAKANLAAALRQLEGARTLHEAGAMSDVDFQARVAQYEAAQAQVAAAEAQLAGASEQARRATIVAPITGVVSERAVSEGEAVNVGQKLLTVVNADTLELSGQISVQQAARVRVGLPVTFTLETYPGQEFTGRVSRVDPVADPETRRVGAALELPNPGHKLVAGQFVNGRVITANVGEALQVPQSALRGELTSPYVLVVEGDTVVQRPVKTGIRDATSGMVVITSGLRDGEWVIISRATDIQPGSKVRLAPETGTR